MSIISNTNTIILLRQDSPISNIKYKIITDNDWTTITQYPIIINNTNDSVISPLIINLISDIRLDTPLKYFVLNTGNITIDGDRYKINIDNVTNYPGLIQNNIFSIENITISNININVINSTLAENGGWIGQSNFGKQQTNCLVKFCSSNGPISNNGGGILGSDTATSGEITINNCYSTGTIGQSAGGILGKNTAIDGGNVKVQYCYSTGSIGYFAGGIIGEKSSGICDTSYCYSLGTINNYAGGIYGSDAGIDGGIARASDCYSTGVISEFGGGIFGNGARDGCTVINCYTSGLATDNQYGFFGSNKSNNVIISDSLANGVNLGQWYDLSANTVLTNVNTIWISATNNLISENSPEETPIQTPYLLSTFKKNFYDDIYNVSLPYGINKYSDLTITGKGTDYVLLSSTSLNGEDNNDNLIFIENNGIKKGQIRSEISNNSGIILDITILNGTPINNSYYDYNIINVNINIIDPSANTSTSILDTYNITLSDDGTYFIGDDDDLRRFISDFIMQDTFVSSDIKLNIIENAISYVSYTNLNPSIIDTEEYKSTLGVYLNYILTTYTSLQRYKQILSIILNSYDINKLDKIYQSKFLRMQYKATTSLARLLSLNSDLLKELNNTKITNSAQYPNIDKSINSTNMLTKNLKSSVSTQLENETEESILSTTTKITDTISNQYTSKLQKKKELFQINNNTTNETNTTLYKLYKDTDNTPTTNIKINSTNDNTPSINQTKIFSNVNILFKGGSAYNDVDVTKDPDFVRYLMDLEYRIPDNQASYIYEDNGLIKWFIEEEIVYNNVLDYFFQRKSTSNYMDALKYYLNTEKNINSPIKTTIADIIQSNKTTNKDNTLYGLSYNSFSDKKNNLTMLQLCRMLQYTSGRLGYFNKHNVSYNYDYYISTPIYNSSSNPMSINKLSIYNSEQIPLSLNVRKDISIYYVTLNNIGVIDSSSLINYTITDSSSINSYITSITLSKSIILGSNKYLQCVVSNGNIYDVSINIPNIYTLNPVGNTPTNIINLSGITVSAPSLLINSKLIDSCSNIYTINNIIGTQFELDKTISTNTLVTDVTSLNIVATQHYIDAYNFEEISTQQFKTEYISNTIITNVLVVNPMKLIDTRVYDSTDTLLKTKITDLSSSKNNKFINIDNLFEWNYTTSTKKNTEVETPAYIVIPVKLNEPFTFIDSSNTEYTVSYSYYYMNNNVDNDSYIRQELDLFSYNNPTGSVVEIYNINNNVQTNACLTNACIIDTSSGNSYKLTILRSPINLIDANSGTEYVSSIKNYPYGIIIRKIINIPIVFIIGQSYSTVLSLFMNFSFTDINFINLSTVETKIEDLIVIDIDPYSDNISYNDYTEKYSLYNKPPLRVCLDDNISIYCNTLDEWKQ